jgi:type VI secretion system protein ImpE
MAEGKIMRAEEKLRDGDLQGAVAELQDQIRQHPEESRYRVFLFQLLTVLGQWERALNQLRVLEKLDGATWSMVQMYTAAIQCEALRSEIFAGRQTPLIFGEPPAWMASLVEALRLTADDRHDQAAELRRWAFEQADPSAGTINDQPFEWIADADSRLGPVLEIIINGRYYWAPFQQIRLIRISPPEDLRDMVWMPARFAWVNGGEAVGLIPTRYPGSESAEDAALQMAGTTRWRQVFDGAHHGLGQRMLATDQYDYPLLEVRSISMNPEVA